MELNINTDEVVKFTNKLEKMHRSALPVAIRGALNKAAFDVKQNTMPKSAEREFVNRQPNFFKANSRVEMAKGFDVQSMEAVVGFTEQGLKGGNNHAVKDLEQQERGGTIQSRSFVPMSTARSSKSAAKNVRPINRLSNVNRIINSNTNGSGSKKQNFIKAATEAGPGGYVIGNNPKKTLWRIDSIIQRGGRTVIRKTPLYSFQDNRSVTVKATGFMKEASLQSVKRIEEWYIAEAKRQIERLK